MTAAATNPEFTSVNALTALLSTESLLFTALNIALALSAPTGKRLRMKPRTFAIAAAGLLAIIASGALMAWFDTFLRNWPTGWYGVFPAICIAIGIVAQPPIAYLVARDVGRAHTEITPKHTEILSGGRQQGE